MSNLNNAKPASSNLLSDLNALLNALHIPKRLSSATHLTPVIILDILERMLHSSLPIPAEIRQCRTRTAKVQAMKIFLGIIADDLLKVDVLLDHVDPRRLADGKEDEVVYVGELLCWLGKKLRYIPEDPHLPLAGPSKLTEEDVKERPLSPSTRSTVTSGTATFGTLSTPSELETTMTSIASVMDHEASFDLDRSFSSSYEKEETSSKPWCIHELQFPSKHHSPDLHDSNTDYDQSMSSDQSLRRDEEEDIFSLPPTKVPIRHSGWLGKVDTEREIQQFEAVRQQHLRSRNRTISSSQTLSEKADKSLPQSNDTIASTSAPQRTLFLLNERARLLTELAEIHRKYSYNNHPP